MKGKTWLLISILCIALGIGLFLASGVRSGGDLNDVLSDAGYSQRVTRKTYEVTESFRNISVEESSEDVQLLPSTDGRCRVTCGETDRCSYTVKVEKDTLTVVREDDESVHFGFTLYNESVPLCIYLPEKSYQALSVSCTSGDVEAAGFSFDTAEIRTTSGEVELRAITVKALSVSCTSGDLFLEELSCSGEAKLHSASGEIRAESCSLGSLELSSTSGDVELIRVVCTGDAKAETTSGEITLTDVGAASFDLSCTSGDVEGSVLGPVDFIVNTVSGDVRTVGGVRGAAPCRVHTTSGSVDLEVTD